MADHSRSGSRLSLDEYFLRMAELVALRTTCARRAVGCVLVNAYNHVMATGYNGVAAGQPHCIEHHCPGAGWPSGQGLHLCEAIHAEQNALLQCHDITTIDTCYCTASPCVHCIRLLLNTNCNRIVFRTAYPHLASEKLWRDSGREWVCVPKQPEGCIIDNTVRWPDGSAVE